MMIHQAIRAIAFSTGTAFIVALVPNVDAQSPQLIGGGSESGIAGTVQNGLFLQGKDSYRVVDTAGFRTAADLGATQPGTIAKVGYGQACTSCGTACGGSCGGASFSACESGACGTGACGTGGCGPCGSSYGAGGPDLCAPCEPFCYVAIDALYMDQGSFDAFTLSRDFGIGDIQYELGSRITIGSVPDCVNGCEITYTGQFEWNRSRSVTAADNGGNPLGTLLRAGNGFNPNDLSSFGDLSQFTNPILFPFPEAIATATAKSQRYESEYWSLEANRTIFGGEFAKLLCGPRYINFDGLFEYNSVSPAGPGQLLSLTDNDLYGWQVGMDLLFPVCCYGYTDLRARAGAYANRAANAFRLVNAGGLVQGGADAKTQLAGQFELGAGVRYQIGEILSIRAGAELWYLSRVATPTGQFRRTITPRTGRRTSAGEDVMFTGVSLGAELLF